VTAHRTRELGLLVTELGGGHLTEGDVIDHAVGLADVAAPGTEVGPDRPLCVVHARDAAAADRAAVAVRALMAVGEDPGELADPPVVTEELR
jgi:thymidine phosphorylase